MTNQERLLALNYVLDEQFKILRNVLSHITFKQFNVSVYLNNSQSSQGNKPHLEQLPYCDDRIPKFFHSLYIFRF